MRSFGFTLIDAVIPPGSRGVEARGDVPEATALPEELASLGAAGDMRRREFTIGRTCARRALAALGIPVGPIVRGVSREPVWPAGVVGSITHCRGYCAAVAAPTSRLLAIGIDAEPHTRLPHGVLAKVAVRSEQEWIQSLPECDVCWDLLLFSAKESVFKAWFQITRAWLGFDDVHVSFDVRASTFLARLLVPGPMVGGRTITVFDGRYRVSDGFVVTSATIDAMYLPLAESEMETFDNRSLRPPMQQQ